MGRRALMRTASRCLSAAAADKAERLERDLVVELLVEGSCRLRRPAGKRSGASEIAAAARFALARAVALLPVEHGELGVEALQHDLGRVALLLPAGPPICASGASPRDRPWSPSSNIARRSSPRFSLKITTRCHSVFSRRSPVALSRQLSLVATRRLAMARPSWVWRISGSAPRLPIRMTLLTDPAM